MSKRRPRFTTRFSRLRNLLQTVISRRLTWFTPRARLYMGFGLLVLACTVLLHGFASGGIEFYQVGEIVHNTVISPADITATDVVDTKRRRNEAMVSARPVFHYDPAVGDYAV